MKNTYVSHKYEFFSCEIDNTIKVLRGIIELLSLQLSILKREKPHLARERLNIT